ncbi:MAG: hypothetical protein ACE5E4_07560 [Candidatus Binatia bacterium]
MGGTTEELKRLLALYRKGHISEDLFIEQMAELEGTDPGSASPEPAAGNRGPRGPSLVDMLDSYRAAEASGAATIRAWIDLTDDGELEGGLRTIAAREAAHAELLEQRLAELGVSAQARIPEWLERYNAAILDPSASDLDRLGAIVAQFPRIEDAVEPVRRMAQSVTGDELTREILLTICDDESATLSWFHDAWKKRQR